MRPSLLKYPLLAFAVFVISVSPMPAQESTTVNTQTSGNGAAEFSNTGPRSNRETPKAGDKRIRTDMEPALPASQPTTSAAPDPKSTDEVKPSVLMEEPELERPTVWGEPTEVQIGIYVIDVDEVN